MSNFRRRLLMNVEKKYTPVEYLESTGTQYIITDKYLDSSELNIKTKLYVNEVPSDEHDIIGNQVQNAGRFTVGLSGKRVFGFSGNQKKDNNVTSSYFTGEQILEIEVNYSYVNRLKILTVNGVTTEQSQNVEITNSNEYITIFPRRYAGFIGKLYYMKLVKNSNEIMFDFIPVLDKDGVPCLYDKVEDKFYYNEGSGEFLYE